MCLQQAPRTVSHCAAFQYLVADLSYPSVISLFTDTTSPPCTRLAFKPFITAVVSSASSSTWHQTLPNGLTLPRTVLSSAAPSSPNSRVCVDFLSSVSFLLPIPLAAQPGSPHPRYCCSRSQLPQWGRRQELLWGCSGVLWGTAASAPRASKCKLCAGRCSSAPVGPAPGLSSAPCGAGGRGARGALLPPLCSSRALVSGEQLPSLTRYSWNSLKPMDWKMPCW